MYEPHEDETVSDETGHVGRRNTEGNWTTGSEEMTSLVPRAANGKKAKEDSGYEPEYVVGEVAMAWNSSCRLISGSMNHQDTKNFIANAGLDQSDRKCKCLSPAFHSELKTLVIAAIPIIVLSWLDQSMTTVTAIFSGQLGKNELAAISLAMATTNMLCQSAGKGFVAVSLTYISQSNGSKNPRQAGMYLQTALIIIGLVMLLTWSILFNIYYILILLGQDPLVAEYASDFAMIFPIGCAGRVLYWLLSRYLFTQDKFMPSICISLFANILNAILQYVFVYACAFGLKGSAWAYTIAYLSNNLLHIGYIYFSRIYVRTWGGWSRFSLLEWGRFTKLSLFSILMLGIEDSMWEVGILLSGMLGVAELAASSILLQLWPLFGSTQSGLRDVTSVRLGQLLGERQSDGSKRVTRISYLLAVSMGLVICCLLLALKEQLPKMFTTAQDVLSIASMLMLVLSLLSFVIALKRSTDGILVGCGKQIQGGLISFLAYIIVAVPIIGLLMFYSPVGVYGYWWGMVVGFSVGSLCQCVIIGRTDWRKEVERAQVRAKTKKEQIEETSC